MKKITLTLSTLVIFLCSIALAEVPSTMQFQGYLTDTVSLPLEGIHTITFTIYDEETDGNSVWTDSQAVTIEAGSFSATLGGTNNPLDANIFGGVSLWLAISVDTGVELSPRSLVSSVPYATRASMADNVMSEAQVQSIIDEGGYLTTNTETDPLFSTASAFGITETDISNWNACFAWGNHGNQAYINDAFDDLSSKGKLDFSEPDDIVTKSDLDGKLGNYVPINTYNDVLDRIVTLETLLNGINSVSDACALEWDNCSENAMCTDTENGFTCECETGYAGDGVTCNLDIEYWTWTDPDTGIMWQKSSAGTREEWQEAYTYCRDLVLAGFDDWVLPSVSGVRSLIKGCPETETGGICAIINSCLDGSCISSDCFGCSTNEGPFGGLYIPLQTANDYPKYWTNSICLPFNNHAYYCVDYEKGSVDACIEYALINIRCARS